MPRVWLDGCAREVIALEATKRRLKESGGLLFGYCAPGGVVIVSALPPGPRTRHERARLVPDPRDTQAAIDKVHEESGGRLHYLGDWHSHPRGSARPSGTDSANARKIAADKAVETPKPLVIIQATAPFRIHVGIRALGVYQWCPAQERLVRRKVEVVSITDSWRASDYPSNRLHRE